MAKNKNKTDKKVEKIVLGAIVLFVALIVVALAITVSGGEEQQVADEDYLAQLEKDGLVLYNDPHSGIRLTYPDDMAIRISEDPSQTQGVTFTLNKDDPKVQVTSWSEQGESISKLSVLGESMSKLILSNVKKQLDSIYPEANIISEKLREVNGYKAGELVFTYRANDGSKAKQRMLVVVKNSDTAVTLAAQSREEDYDTVNKDYFERIIESVTF